MTAEFPMPDTDPWDIDDPDSDFVEIRTYRKPRTRASDTRRRLAIHTSGTHLKSKTPVALYSCTMPAADHDRIYDEMCPMALGWNIAFNPPETRSGRTTWLALIANSKATSQVDLRDEIMRVFGWEREDVVVHKIMGVGFIGGMEHIGTYGDRPSPKSIGTRSEFTHGRPM